MSFRPASCPVCGSVGARALMLDHIESEHPGQLMQAPVCDEDQTYEPELANAPGYDWLGRPKHPRLEALRQLDVDECYGCRGGMVRYCPIHGLNGIARR